jgi:hypothetical protein
VLGEEHDSTDQSVHAAAETGAVGQPVAIVEDAGKPEGLVERNEVVVAAAVAFQV